MKTVYYLFLFLCISVITFGQTQVTKTNDAKCNGSAHQGLFLNGSNYDRQKGTFFIGNHVTEGRGRGYLEFDLQDVPSNANITKADLKLSINTTRKTSESFVVRNLPNSSDCSGSSGEYMGYNGGSSISTISDVRQGDLKTLSIITQVNANKGNRLNLSFIHGTESDQGAGLSIGIASLEITYTLPPDNAPTGLAIVPNSITAKGCSLTWISPSVPPPTGYRIYNGSTMIKDNITATNTSITGLNSGTTYSLCVKAYNTAGESSCSTPPVTFNTLDLISGPAVVCYDGEIFKLIDPPSGDIYWKVVDNCSSIPFPISPSTLFTVNSTGNPTTVTRIGASNLSLIYSNSTLSAHTGGVNGPIVATKTIIPCIPSISGPTTVCYNSSDFTLIDYAPGTTTTWSVTGPFTVYPVTGNQTSITRTGTGGGTLTAINDGYPYHITINSCIAKTFSITPVNSNRTETNCGDITVQNVTVTGNATLTVISCGNITVNNVTVTNGATLNLKAEGDINIQYVNVEKNAKLILDAAGIVNIISDFEVELGTEFEIK